MLVVQKLCGDCIIWPVFSFFYSFIGGFFETDTAQLRVDTETVNGAVYIITMIQVRIITIKCNCFMFNAERRHKQRLACTLYVLTSKGL